MHMLIHRFSGLQSDGLAYVKAPLLQKILVSPPNQAGLRNERPPQAKKEEKKQKKDPHFPGAFFLTRFKKAFHST
jgi:hypothetical protein